MEKEIQGKYAGGGGARGKLKRKYGNMGRKGGRQKVSKGEVSDRAAGGGEDLTRDPDGERG